ncbi:MAG: glycine cleavage system aminomethyltransferase GcvT [Armatimonadota bacterium]|nr:glycine cleavage system aminomethyltransferase GcvT [Armatimonadota bacterium]MDR7551135.1 glycine cleavage system aminomethyltransferase GcvT [Armatimonadota bacterium]
MEGEPTLRRTPLYDAHRAAGGRMVAFAGWLLPVQYTGITEEHQAVRTHAGLFDVSHMGEIRIDGPQALSAVQRLITNDAARLTVGSGLYSPMCLPSGGIVDDLTVFRVDEQVYLLVVNAATCAKDLAWIREHAGTAAVRDVSEEVALLALQGPRAEAVLADASGHRFDRLLAFHMAFDVPLAGVRTTVSRTGYTGEDGFEIACAWEEALRVWAALLEAGRPHGVVPAGLGARDTLRLEAGFMLYGQDIDETTSPLEARLGWTVKFDKGDFIGREALVRQRAEGPKRRLVGFDVADRTIPRHGCAIWSGARRIGEVTSGTFAPTLRRPIGMGYVSVETAAAGTRIEIDVRGKRAQAQVVRLPFYQRARSGAAR